MSAELLAGIAAAILSLLFTYVPGLVKWYEPKEKPVKQGIMAGLLVVVALCAYGLACAGLAVDFGLSVVCDKAGAIGLVKALLSALMANQGMYLITRK